MFFGKIFCRTENFSYLCNRLYSSDKTKGSEFLLEIPRPTMSLVGQAEGKGRLRNVIFRRQISQVKHKKIRNRSVH